MRTRFRLLVTALAAAAALFSLPGVAFAASAPASAVTSADGDVYAVVPGSDGTMSITVYRPAPGVTASALRAALTAQGVAGVQDASTVTAAALPCSYGSARTLTCPPDRWARNGYNHPQVYFLDHTSAAWPITEVVPEWNLAIGVDSWYRWYTNGCPGNGTHCVNVYDANYGNTGWTGLTHFNANSSQYFIDGSVYSQLNDYYGGTAAQHRNTACHETGHTLGLGHNTSTTSCMYYARTSEQYPNSNDFSMLHSIYPFN